MIMQRKLLAVAVLLAAAPLVQAQDSDALAKQLANPIASLTSVPLQFNYDHGFGSDGDGYKFVLNVQPVIPVSISDDWNMISRTILPIANQDGLIPGEGSQFGLGDTVQSLFFSPKAPTDSGWVWGIGPVFLLPTATDEFLGGEKWGAGPTGVALKQTPTGWTYGVLFNHIWSFAGDEARNDINATFLQPFIAKSLGKGRTVNVAIESTYDWETDQWTAPINFTYSKVSRIGKQLVSYAGGVRYYLEAGDTGPEWGARFTITLLYPKKQ